uniref:Ionotropic glutamate receptor C-terminal domain-containing protein n=1 Tax=Anopheles coluzzii TaxID=1518534 RepID=A0A6E8WD70_ANOCL
MLRVMSVLKVFGVLVVVPVSVCFFLTAPNINATFYAHTLLELHRQVCPVAKYRNLVILWLSHDTVMDAVLPHIISEDTYTKTVSRAVILNITNDDIYHSCNLLLIDSLNDLETVNSLQESVKAIYFYPKWIHEMVKSTANESLLQLVRFGYQVVYDHSNTIAIYRWNKYSNQTTTIDPYKIAVPDETRDMYGYNLTMFFYEPISSVMTFDAYFLELVCSKRNATAIQMANSSHPCDIFSAIGFQYMYRSWLLHTFGTTFIAVNVPRAKPKPIVSVLIDPFDKYVWITYLLLVLAMAVTISKFGEILGRCRFVEIVLELVMTCLAGPSRTYGGTFENRLLTMFCLMGIVLISSYQSLIISFMSIVRYGPEINTLEEIHEQCLFEDYDEPRSFGFKTYPNGTQLGFGLGCSFEKGRDNELLTMMMTANIIHIRQDYGKEDYIRYRLAKYRFANVKMFEYPMCFMVLPRVRDLFLFYIRAVFESGIYEYYYNNKSTPAWFYKRNKFANEVVKVKDLMLLWYAYVCGTLLSIVCLVLENVVHKESKE